MEIPPIKFLGVVYTSTNNRRWTNVKQGWNESTSGYFKSLNEKALLSGRLSFTSVCPEQRACCDTMFLCVGRWGWKREISFSSYPALLPPISILTPILPGCHSPPPPPPTRTHTNKHTHAHTHTHSICPSWSFPNDLLSFRFRCNLCLVIINVSISESVPCFNLSKIFLMRTLIYPPSHNILKTRYQLTPALATWPQKHHRRGCIQEKEL